MRGAVFLYVGLLFSILKSSQTQDKFDWDYEYPEKEPETGYPIHVTVAGDTPESISLLYYGKTDYWTLLRESNSLFQGDWSRNTEFNQGRRLAIPQPTITFPYLSTIDGRRHELKHGDTLGKLAQRYYGHQNFWLSSYVIIYSANICNMNMRSSCFQIIPFILEANRKFIKDESLMFSDFLLEGIQGIDLETPEFSCSGWIKDMVELEKVQFELEKVRKELKKLKETENELREKEINLGASKRSPCNKKKTE